MKRICNMTLLYWYDIITVMEVFEVKQRYIPLEKRSKREQKAYFAARRSGWGELSPVTRKTPNPKAYTRKKSGQWYEHEPPPGFHFCGSPFAVA